MHFSHMRGPFAMKHFPLLYTCLRWIWVTWNCHGLFGNKITAEQNLLKSSYRIMNVILFDFHRDVKLIIPVWKLMYLR